MLSIGVWCYPPVAIGKVQSRETMLQRHRQIGIVRQLFVEIYQEGVADRIGYGPGIFFNDPSIAVAGLEHEGRALRSPGFKIRNHADLAVCRVLKEHFSTEQASSSPSVSRIHMSFCGGVPAWIALAVSSKEATLTEASFAPAR